ncbi:hypothetical protein [Ottowia thiooxydans]|uniref:hypothetical protein n=1 Tax=Ottowia thiooxydans TaxID=219182 RepID=UPI00048BDD0D|nr:hypothetical protein [Ottowia thiooxydans]
MRLTERMAARKMLALSLTLCATWAGAHEPVARCFLMDQSTVRCRGASNDGDEMPGSRMQVIALDGATLLEGKLQANSTWTFKKPTQAFYVLFNTGPGLQVTVEQDEITTPPRGRIPRWMQTP